jgi:hypothetical protein
MGRACGAYVEDRGVHRLLVGKPEGKRPLGRQRRRWEDESSGSWRGSLGLDGVGSGLGQVAGTSWYGGGLSCSINVGNFLTSC